MKINFNKHYCNTICLCALPPGKTWTSLLTYVQRLSSLQILVIKSRDIVSNIIKVGCKGSTLQGHVSMTSELLVFPCAKRMFSYDMAEIIVMPPPFEECGRALSVAHVRPSVRASVCPSVRSSII